MAEKLCGGTGREWGGGRQLKIKEVCERWEKRRGIPKVVRSREDFATLNTSLQTGKLAHKEEWYTKKKVRTGVKGNGSRKFRHPCLPYQVPKLCLTLINTRLNLTCTLISAA